MNPYNNLRDAIIDKIVNNETTIKEAYAYEVPKFNGSPVAVVSPSTNEAQYNSQKVDMMTFVFTIRIYIPLVDGNTTATIEENMGLAYWEVLKMFHKRDALEGFTQIVEPLPSAWGYAEVRDGVYRVSEITLRCRSYIDHT